MISPPQGGFSVLHLLIPNNRLTLAGHLLVILLTGWGLAVILPSTIQAVRPLAAFGLTSDNDGVLTDVVQPFEQAGQSPATRAGLVSGDRIDLSRANCALPGGETCASIVLVLGGLGGLQYVWPGKEITLPILHGDNPRPKMVHLRAALAPLRWPVQAVLLADTIVAVFFILTALRLVWTRPSPMTWGFFVYAVWFNPGQTYAYFAILQHWPTAVLVEEFADAVIRGAGYAGLITFALSFPTGQIGHAWRPLGRATPFIAVGLTLMMLWGAANLFGYGTEVIVQGALLSGFAVDTAVLTILFLRRRRLHPQDDQRMRWVITGFAIGLPAFMIAAICQSSALLQGQLGLWPSQVVVGLLYLLNGVLAYFVGVAVRRRRVVSVAIPLRHGTILAVLTVAFSIPIFWLHETMGEYKQIHGLPTWFWPLIIGPITVILLQRVHEVAVNLVDHTFNRRFHHARSRLQRAAKAMLRAGTFTEIDRILTAEPFGALRLSSAAVFRSIDGVYRRMERAIGWANEAPNFLRPDRDRLILSCTQSGQPVRLPRGIWDATCFPEEDQAPCLAVPVAGGAREADAIVLFGPHRTGSDIDQDEREMLRELASHAGLAYDRVETETLRQEVTALRARLPDLTTGT